MLAVLSQSVLGGKVGAGERAGTGDVTSWTKCLSDTMLIYDQQRDIEIYLPI
jgi:hypothetical protein